MTTDATRVCVLHPEFQKSAERGPSAKSALAEAESLALALNLDVVDSDVVKVAKPRPGYLFGSGKTEELKARLQANDVELVIIDGALTPVQQRNLESIWNVKILDRTGLILEIFADRAATREGVLQVELAALSYQRTRLVRSWTHLERQRGGLGFVGGPGETQIEADRRAIDDAIVRLRRQLQKVVKTRGLHRASRKKVPYPIVALVGYTNAGKSTLFNRMTGAKVLAKDMLFATLDPTMRALELPNGRRVIMSDTVGFISQLPTQLVASFRATLEEVLDADLIIHVRDISHAETENQAKDVADILSAMGIETENNNKILEAWNKVDLLSVEDRAAIEELTTRDPMKIPFSALTGQGIDKLSEAIDVSLAEPRIGQKIVLAYSQGKERAWLFELGLVEDEVVDDDGYELLVNWTKKQAGQFMDEFQSDTGKLPSSR